MSRRREVSAAIGIGAAWRLDLDDVRAEVSKDDRGSRSRDVSRQFNNANAVEDGFAHQISLSTWSIAERDKR